MDRRRPGGRGRPRDRLTRRLPQLPHPDPDVGGDGHLHPVDGPEGGRLVEPDPRGARHPQLRGPSRAGARCPAARGARGPRRRLPLPGRRAARPLRHQLRRHRRPHHRHHRQHRCREDEPGEPARPALRPDHRARCASTAWTCATWTPTGCGRASAWCPRGRTSSRARWRATCSSASPTPPRRTCGRPSRSPRPPTSCGPCPVASRRASSRAAPTCRAGSANASRSPGRSCGSPSSTCSTTRSRRSTSPPTPASGPPSSRTPAMPRW